VDKICKHDINVFINRQLIYNYPEQVSIACFLNFGQKVLKLFIVSLARKFLYCVRGGIKWEQNFATNCNALPNLFIIFMIRSIAEQMPVFKFALASFELCRLFTSVTDQSNRPQLFADKGVMAIEHADFDGIERLALVTGTNMIKQSRPGLPDVSVYNIPNFK
jgi:hypothetical protein